MTAQQVCASHTRFSSQHLQYYGGSVTANKATVMHKVPT